jgi:hypothetical protein
MLCNVANDKARLQFCALQGSGGAISPKDGWDSFPSGRLPTIALEVRAG